MAIKNQVDFSKLEYTTQERSELPLFLKNILFVDFIDIDVPYQKMMNKKTEGLLFGQHSQRKISLIVDYKLISNLIQKDEL